MKRDKEYFRGCLADGALGYPVEFSNSLKIKKRYGPDDITGLRKSSSGKALFTEYTQMTLFNAEGILRTETKRILKGIYHPSWTGKIDRSDVLLRITDDLLLQYNENNTDLSRYPDT